MLLAEISTLLHPPPKLCYVLIAQHDVGQSPNVIQPTTLVLKTWGFCCPFSPFLGVTFILAMLECRQGKINQWESGMILVS